MSEDKLLSKIRKDARKIAKRFRLKYLQITREPKQVKSRYGSCDEDRVIRIRLRQSGRDEFLKYSNLVHTLCHELAHTKYMNHGKGFKELNAVILDWARKKKIYRPKSRKK